MTKTKTTTRPANVGGITRARANRKSYSTARADLAYLTAAAIVAILAAVLANIIM